MLQVSTDHALTGSSKGVKEIAQQLKGRHLKGALLFSLCPPHSVCHSVAVIYPRSFLRLFFPMLQLFLSWVMQRLLAGKRLQ
jgi:hypothetical protein